MHVLLHMSLHVCTTNAILHVLLRLKEECFAVYLLLIHCQKYEAHSASSFGLCWDPLTWVVWPLRMLGMRLRNPWAAAMARHRLKCMLRCAHGSTASLANVSPEVA